MSKHSLLLVDGDTRSLRVLEVSLRKAGFTVTPAGSVQDALDKLELDSPDLIISETTFPDGDGFELRRRVRATADWAEIPFVFLTASTAIENKIKGLELGVDDYLTKPIYIKEIITRINILLQKKQRTRFEERRDGRTRFAGRVADMPVIDVIQTIEISRKSGVIQFVGERGRQAAIFFRDGKVIDAEAGALQGEDAVYRLLTWSEGEFEVMFRTVRRREVITTSSQGLLMEGMRRLDEWSRLLEQLPTLTHRFEVDAHELVTRLGEVPDDNNRILRLIDGKRTLLEVIDASDVGDLECLQAISRLFFEELLVDLDHGAPAKRDTGKPMPLVEIDETPTPIEEVASGPHLVGTESFDDDEVPSSAAIREGSGPVRSREDSGLISMPIPRTASGPIPRTMPGSTSGAAPRAASGSSSGPVSRTMSGAVARTTSGESSGPVARTMTGSASGAVARTTSGESSGPVARTMTGSASGAVGRTTSGESSGPVARTTTGSASGSVRTTSGESSGPVARTTTGSASGSASGSDPVAAAESSSSATVSRTMTGSSSGPVPRTASGPFPAVSVASVSSDRDRESDSGPVRSTGSSIRTAPSSITIPTSTVGRTPTPSSIGSTGRTTTPSSITIPVAPGTDAGARATPSSITIPRATPPPGFVRTSSSPALARTTSSSGGGSLAPSSFGPESVSYRSARPSTQDDLAVPEESNAFDDDGPLPEPLMGRFRPSSLRLIDEAVAAAQAIEPSLFADDASKASTSTEEIAEQAGQDAGAAPRNAMNSEGAGFTAGQRNGSMTDAWARRASEESGLRAITSLGRDRAEASGEFTPVRGATPPSEEGAPQRELVTILPRRSTREMAAVSVPGVTDVPSGPVQARTTTGAESAPTPIERESSSKMRVPEARTTTGEIRAATPRAITNRHVISSTGDVRTTERTTGEIRIGEPGDASAAAPTRRTPPGEIRAVEPGTARTPTGSFRVVELDRRDSGPLARGDRTAGRSPGIDPRTGAPIERTTGELKAIEPGEASTPESSAAAASESTTTTTTTTTSTSTSSTSSEGRRLEASGEIRPDELRRPVMRASSEMRAQGDIRGSMTRSSGAHEISEHVSGEIRAVRPKTEGRTSGEVPTSANIEATATLDEIDAAEGKKTGEIPVAAAVEQPVTSTDADGARVLPPRPEGRAFPPPTRRPPLEGSGVRRKAGPGASVIVLLCLAGIAAAIAVYLRVRKNHRPQGGSPTDAAIAPGGDADVMPAPESPASSTIVPTMNEPASVSTTTPPTTTTTPTTTTATTTPTTTPTDTTAPTDAPVKTPAGNKTDAGSADASPEGKVQQAKQLMEKAQAALEGGQADKAVEMCDQSLKLRRTARTLLLKSQALQKLTRVDDALAAVSDANLVFLQSEGRDFPAGWELKGKILWSAQRFDEARAAYQHFLELEPNGKAAAEARRRLEESR